MENNQIATVETAKELGLLPEEYDKIKEYFTFNDLDDFIIFSTPIKLM